MTPLTRIEGVPSKNEVKPGMAFFEGTGPAGKFCGDCMFRKEDRPSICMKFTVLAGKRGPPVRAYWRSCKYFVEKKR